VTVLHVPDPPHVPFGMAPPPPLPPGYRGAWENQLRLIRPTDPTVPVVHRLEEGDPATEILRVAGDSACDLIVMGSSRRSWLWRTVVGGVSRSVARRARCPVVRVTVPEEKSYPIASGRVVYATDEEEPDAFSLGLAHSLAWNAGEELFVLSVRPTRGSEPDGRGTAKPRLPARLPGVRPLVREGSLVEEVLRAAHDLRPALVVMGTPGRTGVGELFDPTRAVRRTVACPVLSVHLPNCGRREVAGVDEPAGCYRQEGRA
jgi:nucleotide-binding universal stress UspA family protein